jgi:SAM-dependent methyltransferase
MAEALAPRVAPDARFLGVDACVANAVPFLQRAGRARFESRRLTDSLPWPDAHFDLVVCSYSLYFFPAVLPEIARVLRPDGRLLVLTHSVRSFVELLAAAGLDPERSPLLALVCRFPAEGAEDRLSRHFAEVDRVDYPNALRFGPDDLAEAETYLRFKLPLLHGAAPEAPELLASARAAIQSWLRAHGELVVTKDDAGFRCRRPRPGGS